MCTVFGVAGLGFAPVDVFGLFVLFVGRGVLAFGIMTSFYVGSRRAVLLSYYVDVLNHRCDISALEGTMQV